jgi:septum site-determining protein MinC
MGAIARPTRQPVRMRGRSYVAFVFCPVVPILGWLGEIDATLRSSPGFFAGKPVVLDLSAVDLSSMAIAQLVASLEQRNIRKNETKPKPASLLLDGQVRSGQSIVFPDGDVTVVGSVSSGAEIVAGGSIHIYGTLRGRAMAGINGNSAARIYCHKIEAELLAIDGYYRTAEEIDAALCDRPMQVWLQGDVVQIAPLS